MKKMIDSARAYTILKYALSEDIDGGDVTTSALIPEKHKSRAVIRAKEAFILAGIPFAERIFKLSNPELKFKANKKDGDRVKKDTVIARISGSTRGLLMAERTALNFLQRLSGIATLTRKFAESVRGIQVKVVDTRKTTPGIRIFEKYAVKVGGGTNHRLGLFDGILIKDNHINVAGSIEKAVSMAKKNVQHMLRVEVEVKNITQVRSALSAGVEIIMLDNMSLENTKKSVKIIRSHSPHVIIEASGNITMNNIRHVAETGVDLISIGALTHSATAVDISMSITPLRTRT
ncbi:MAG: carboxylating nicotinate-nucleotide diphosphorylase [Thermodesulfovibrionia bacterium]|nr:carboxylating nicotinate-nucleotide diphosphorylase [Thermodesulfovibrionia bacterium]